MLDANKFKAEFEKYQKECVTSSNSEDGEKLSDDNTKQDEQGDKLADDLDKLKVEDSNGSKDTDAKQESKPAELSQKTSEAEDAVKADS